MRANTWYAIARTSDRECTARVSFSIDNSEVVFDVFIQYGNISIAIVSATVQPSTTFFFRVRSQGGFFYVDVKSNVEISAVPSAAITLVLNNLVALEFAPAGDGVQECIISTEAYTPAPTRTYVTIEDIQVIQALKYFADGLAIGTQSSHHLLSYGADGLYLDSTKKLTTDDELTQFVNDGDYNSTTKKIELKHNSTVIAEIDATAFIKDGMVSDVEVRTVLIDGVPTKCLVITFNTDAGKEPITIPLSDIFDSSLYYTKVESDARFLQLTGGIISGTLQVDGAFIMPNHAPTGTLVQNRGYLYSDPNGNYSQDPEGSVAHVFDLYLYRGAVRVGPYNLSEDDQEINLASFFTGYATESWVQTWVGNQHYLTSADLSSYVNNVVSDGNGNAVTGFSKSGSTLTLLKGNTFVDIGSNQVVTGTKSLASLNLLNLPQVSPSSLSITGVPASGAAYLYSDANGNYSQEPEGSVAKVFDLYLYRGAVRVGPYNLSEEDAEINLATFFSGYATESFVTSQGYATQNWVTSQGYLTSAALSAYVNSVTEDGQGNAYTSLTKSGSSLVLHKGNTFVDLTSAQTITGAKKHKNVALLHIPGSAPSAGDIENNKSYLYADANGAYSQEMEGGVAKVFDLYLYKGSTRVGPYNLGEEDAEVNLASFFTGYALESWVTAQLNNATAGLAEGIVSNSARIHSLEDWVQDWDIDDYVPLWAQQVSKPSYAIAEILGSSSIGGATSPVYYNGSTFVAADAYSTLFTAFTGGGISSSGNTLTQADHSITVGGVTKTAGSSTAPIVNSLSVSSLTSNSTTNLSAKITVNGVESSAASITDLYARYASRLLSDSSCAAWGQTFWSNGVPNSISGALTSVTDITATGFAQLPSIYASTSLAIPTSAPSTSASWYSSSRYYLYTDTNGNYSQTPSGGGGGVGETLTLLLNGASFLTYNGSEAVTKNITALQTADIKTLTIQKNGAAFTGNTYNPLDSSNTTINFTITKSDVGLSNVENTALSTWAGTTNITTLGTITTGVWNGTAIANNKLANSSVTIGSATVSLGGSASLSDIGLSSWAQQSTKPSYTFSEIGSKPTTLSGYGITDAVSVSDLLPLTEGVVHNSARIQSLEDWMLGEKEYDWNDIANRPTTLAGYRISDAYISGGVVYLGSNSITPLVASHIKTLTLQVAGSTVDSYSPLTQKTINITTAQLVAALNSSDMVSALAEGETSNSARIKSLEDFVRGASYSDLSADSFAADSVEVGDGLVIPTHSPRSPKAGRYYFYVNPNGNYAQQ